MDSRRYPGIQEAQHRLRSSPNGGAIAFLQILSQLRDFAAASFEPSCQARLLKPQVIYAGDCTHSPGGSIGS